MPASTPHDIARKARDSGSWRTDPEPLIAVGARMFASNVAAVKNAFPAFDEQHVLKTAASGYNAGIGTAISSARPGDSDARTTGHDYGADVLARMAIFEELTPPGP